MFKADTSLMHDLLFKETFANEKNRRQLERLLELILDYPENYLKDKLIVHYESPINKQNLKQKSIRGDIVVEFEDTLINIEAYTNFNLSSIDKSIYYIMRIQSNKLEIGDNYYKLGKTVQINFVKNSKLNLENKLITNFHITSDDNLELKLLVNNFCIKIVQIDKIKELKYTNNILEKWLGFIGANNFNKRKDFAEGDELLMELNNWVDKYINDEETMEKLNKWDIQIATQKGYDEGKELGIKQGIEQGIEQERKDIIKNMIKAKVSVENISKFTGLPIKEIEKIKEG